MANHDAIPTEQIATRSVDEALDFACNLLAGAIRSLPDRTPEAAPNVLKTLSEYISFRYAGEDLLALEYLVLLGRELRESPDVQWTQFWGQLEWLGQRMGASIGPLGKAG